MSCERFREALSRHAAGADIDGAAGAHLAGCDACAARLDLQRQLLSEMDGELERLLSIEASPELVARVVSGSRGAGGSFWGFGAAWVGLAAAALFAIGIYLRGPSAGPATVPADTGSRAAISEPNAPASVATSPRAPFAVESTTHGPAVPNRSRQVAVRRRTVTRVAEPPVIVQPDQALAIARLKELLMEGRLREEMLPAPQSESTVAELTIAPLEITEIRVANVEIVGHPPSAPRERQ